MIDTAARNQILDGLADSPPLFLRDTRARVSAPGLPPFATLDLKSFRDGVVTYEGMPGVAVQAHGGLSVEIMRAGEVVATSAVERPVLLPSNGILSVSIEVSP